MTLNPSTNAAFERNQFQRFVEWTRRAREGRQPRAAIKALTCVGLISAFAILMMFGERPVRQRTLEATAQMERLATVLSHAQTIAPATAQEIAQLIQQPHYDCMQVRCGTALETRNLMAQSRLKMLIGGFPEGHAATRRDAERSNQRSD